VKTKERNDTCLEIKMKKQGMGGLGEKLNEEKTWNDLTSIAKL